MSELLERVMVALRRSDGVDDYVVVERGGRAPRDQPAGPCAAGERAPCRRGAASRRARRPRHRVRARLAPGWRPGGRAGRVARRRRRARRSGARAGLDLAAAGGARARRRVRRRAGRGSGRGPGQHPRPDRVCRRAAGQPRPLAHRGRDLAGGGAHQRAPGQRLSQHADPVDGFLAGSGQRLSVRSRRLDELDWASTVARAAARDRGRARATRLPPGSYDLVLADDALVPDMGAAMAPERAAPWNSAAPAPSQALARLAAFGWFGPLLAQADAHLVRQGLSRYDLGQSIHGELPLRGEPLTLSSDGTLPYALRSRRFGDWGEPMRQLTLIEDGVAADMLSDLREAALRGVMPTGGPGNVVLPPGRTLPDALRARAGRPVLEAVALSWLAVEPRTGDFAAEIDLGYLDDGNAVIGGGFRGNVFALLAGARYSARLAARAWYRGPEALRIDDVRMT